MGPPEGTAVVSVVWNLILTVPLASEAMLPESTAILRHMEDREVI